jgi:hypothetical protein
MSNPQELEWVTVAFAVDLPPDDVAWWTEPQGAHHWANATRLNKNPVLAWWRSAHAPVWNHRIVRPALVWDAEGVRDDVLNALREGRGEDVRTAGPTENDLTRRLQDELAVSRKALIAATEEYERRRWSPGKLDRSPMPCGAPATATSTYSPPSDRPVVRPGSRLPGRDLGQQLRRDVAT